MLSEKNICVKTPLKGFRNTIEPGIIYFSWFPTYDCNYRCSYCAVQEVAHTPFTNPAGFEVLAPDRWDEIWKRIYDKYGTVFIHVNGGEPFHYPNFLGIIEKISKYHIMEFSTNLSFDVADFMNTISPERVYLIGSSYHPEFADFDEFMGRVKKLIGGGYITRFNIVAYPPFIDSIGGQLKKMRDEGVKCTALLFHGRYKGHLYPQAYTQHERDIMLTWKNYLGPEFEKMLSWSLRKKEDVPRCDSRGGDGLKSPRKVDEVLCRMGQMYSRIHPDGVAVRCCAKTDVIVGNIFDENFSLYEEAKPCDDPDCICWRRMVVGKEREWRFGWPNKIK